MSINGYGQSVENVRYDNGRTRVVITYDIVSNDDSAEYAVKVYPSFDGGTTYGACLKAVKGDTWKVKPGNGRTVTWNFNDEFLGRTGEVTLQLRAYRMIRIKYEGKDLFVTRANASMPGSPVSDIRFGNDSTRLVIIFNVSCDEDSAQTNIRIFPGFNEGLSFGDRLRAVEGDTGCIGCGKNKIIIWNYRQEEMAAKSYQVAFLKDRSANLWELLSSDYSVRGENTSFSNNPEEITLELFGLKSCGESHVGASADILDQVPSFPGGKSELTRYINKNMKYPKEAWNKGIAGFVETGFTVTEEGKIMDVTVLSGADPLLDAEAVRIITAMPDWNPGIIKGVRIRTTCSVPVEFRIR